MVFPQHNSLKEEKKTLCNKRVRVKEHKMAYAGFHFRLTPLQKVMIYWKFAKIYN